MWGAFECIYWESLDLFTELAGLEILISTEILDYLMRLNEIEKLISMAEKSRLDIDHGLRLRYRLRVSGLKDLY